VIKTATHLGLAALIAAIGVFWAQHDAYSPTMFSALGACVALGGMLAILGLGRLMFAIEMSVRRFVLRRHLGVTGSLGGYVLVENPQPTL